ncbi:unnamed protein product [Acanthoscelides obtectus]|uniref:HTH psq-type domain-containing protein n=1 Tax=Acanthoscelides obtectus TaxID=200917 RepID=A0A9P0VNH3_ACAOB|nr:unnamed protein product [Acanthoscelides obtectus]CAK1659912.1 hypothetical protein AOBTE_LOCUS21748 [Acanthoscelides obtectus]
MLKAIKYLLIATIFRMEENIAFQNFLVNAQRMFSNFVEYQTPPVRRYLGLKVTLITPIMASQEEKRRLEIQILNDHHTAKQKRKADREYDESQKVHIFVNFTGYRSKMPRSKLNVKRPPVNSTALENAVKAVLDPENISLREACKIFGVKLTTLSRHLSRFRKSESQTFEYKPRLDNKKVFTDYEENCLLLYIKKVAKMNYGLTKKSFPILTERKSSTDIVNLLPEDVVPYPKAKPRKATNKGRKRGKTMIATDTPEKERRQKKNQQRKQVQYSSSEEEDDIVHLVETDDEDSNDEECLFCNESFKNDIHGEQWIRCMSCLGWAHELCAATKEGQIVYDFFVITQQSAIKYKTHN